MTSFGINIVHPSGSPTGVLVISQDLKDILLHLCFNKQEFLTC